MLPELWHLPELLLSAGEARDASIFYKFEPTPLRVPSGYHRVSHSDFRAKILVLGIPDFEKSKYVGEKIGKTKIGSNNFKLDNTRRAGGPSGTIA